MSEIPDDIKKSATAAYEAMPLVYDGWDEEAVVACIARALLAERLSATEIERKRVLAIVEQYTRRDAPLTHPNNEVDAANNWSATTARLISSAVSYPAIRSQP